MERRGSGFKKIINAYETQQNYKNALKPIFNSFNNDFILTLFNLNYSANVPQDVPQGVPQDGTVNGTVNGTVINAMKLSANETKVYELLKKDNSINIEQIVATSKISRRTVIRILNNLKDYNIIKRVGSDKTGHWEIIN